MFDDRVDGKKKELMERNAFKASPSRAFIRLQPTQQSREDSRGRSLGSGKRDRAPENADSRLERGSCRASDFDSLNLDSSPLPALEKLTRLSLSLLAPQRARETSSASFFPLLLLPGPSARSRKRPARPKKERKQPHPYLVLDLEAGRRRGAAGDDAALEQLQRKRVERERRVESWE